MDKAKARGPKHSFSCKQLRVDGYSDSVVDLECEGCLERIRRTIATTLMANESLSLDALRDRVTLEDVLVEALENL